MSWGAGVWRYPTNHHCRAWDTHYREASYGGYGPWKTCNPADDDVAGGKLPRVEPGSFASKHTLSRNSDASKTYPTSTNPVGPVAHASHQSERVKLIALMVPEARSLRVAALSSDELDAVIYIATGQKARMRPELNMGTHFNAQTPRCAFGM